MLEGKAALQRDQGSWRNGLTGTTRGPTTAHTKSCPAVASHRHEDRLGGTNCSHQFDATAGPFLPCYAAEAISRVVGDDKQRYLVLLLQPFLLVSFPPTKPGPGGFRNSLFGGNMVGTQASSLLPEKLQGTTRRQDRMRCTCPAGAELCPGGQACW